MPKKQPKPPKQPNFLKKMEDDAKARKKDWDNQYNTSNARKQVGKAVDDFLKNDS